MRTLRLRKRKKNRVKSIDTSGVYLKVSILKGRNLSAGGDNSNWKEQLNPYTVLRANGYRFSTYTVNQSDVIVEWNTDFSISLANWTRAPALSLIVWNKLGATKSYIGEVLIPLSSLSSGLSNSQNDMTIAPTWYKLSSTQTSQSSSADGLGVGELELAFSLGSNYAMDNVAEIWSKFIDNFGGADTSQVNSVSGSVSNSVSGGGNSSTSTAKYSGLAPSTSNNSGNSLENGLSKQPVIRLDPVMVDARDDTPTLDSHHSQDKDQDHDSIELSLNALDISEDVSDNSFAEDLDGYFKGAAVDEDDDADEFDDALFNSLTFKGGDSSASADSYEYPSGTGTATSGTDSLNTASVSRTSLVPQQQQIPASSVSVKSATHKRAGKRKAASSETFELKIDSSVLGIVFMDIESVTDLPPYKNMTRTNFDMDPFVVVSFGKKTFRTPYRRHTLNPVYNERLIFPVHKLEKGYSIQFSVVDKDRLTLNDFIAQTDLPIADILATAPEPDEEGLYDLGDFDYSKNNLGQGGQKTFMLPLRKKKQEKWIDCRPWISLRASFKPYNLLRQQLWRALANVYDADDTKGLNYTELTMLLDSLNSSLTEETKMSYYTRYGKRPDVDELSTDELVLCLEQQILRDSIEDISVSTGNSLASSRASTPPLAPAPTLGTSSAGSSAVDLSELPPAAASSALALASASVSNSILPLDHQKKATVERVVRIAVCPFCNRPRLTTKAEIDMVTHLATCASQNSATMDALVMGRYVTPSQAMKRWYSKVVSKVSYGNYKLGANSANILVQDRVTGYIHEEKMSAYVRVGMRLLYKGIRSSRMEGKRIRNLLRSLSIKQGRKFDHPDSVQSIRPFIKFHKLDTTDVLEPLDSFKNFNEFFYRKLKPGARPCEAPDDEKVAVSAADCRLTVFATVKKSQEVWIKGRNFSISRLIGPVYPDDVDRYTLDGSLAIFRLAPQDYHRFHSPVDGIVGEPKEIAGEYYTVNPMAVRSALDIYTENVRVILPIDSLEFGRVMVCCIGAMMVGSTVITARPGQAVKRTDELGYFKFGGSTLVVLFERNKIVFDSDIATNSESRVETLVRVGMSLGHKPEIDEHEHDYKQKS